MVSSQKSNWDIIDSGIQSARDHMNFDQIALGHMANKNQKPYLRFFEWDKPVVTYGYLLNPEKVQAWAQPYEKVDIVKRPTGGGAVYHEKFDLNISLLWHRQQSGLPENPRDCYEAIHRVIQTALHTYLEKKELDLFVKAPGSCEQPNDVSSKRFSVCFNEPVCNDVMMGQKKIVGGALRLTRDAILYQGSIQLGKDADLDSLKKQLKLAFSSLFSL